MTRKDEKDTERPHYYSQFWLDVAAGRRVIGTPKTDEGPDSGELDLPEPITTRRSPRASVASVMDGHRTTPIDVDISDDYAIDEDYSEPDVEEEELASDLDDNDIPTLLVDEAPEEVLEVPAVASIPEVLPADDEEVVEDEEEFFDDEEEEEEDEDGWAARGRKKPKPGRQVKTPKPPVKKPKRTGRGF